MPYLGLSARNDIRITTIGSANVDGSLVVNESSADKDFRVESDGNTHMLFVNGGNNCVGIGNASPTSPLHVTGTVTATGFSGKIHPTSGTTTHYLSLDSTNELNFKNASNASQTLHINYDGGNVDLGASAVVVTHGGATTFGGAITANAGVVVDNITIDGNDISTTNTNGNLTITPNGTGDLQVNSDRIKVRATEGESAAIMLAADEQDDGGDSWNIIANTDNTFALQNDKSGSADVTHFSITPADPVANSTATFAGKATFANNVGVGTSSPTDTGSFGRALDVSSSTGAAVYVRDSGGSKVGHFGQYNEQTSIVSRQDDGNIAFYTGASPTEKARIHSTGLFEIKNLSQNYGDEATIRGTTSTGGPKGEIAFKRESSGDDTSIVFRSSNNGTLNATAMTLNSDGRLGLGTGSPYAILQTEQDVAGEATALALVNNNVDGASDSVCISFGLARNNGYLFGYKAIKWIKEQAWTTTASTVDAALTFSTVENETLSERVRIKSNGDFAVGASSWFQSSSAYKFAAQTDANQICQLNYASNASFTQDLHAWDTNKAANSNFNFWRARTNTGASIDTEMILQGTGNFAIDGTVTENGADYAEYFEWKDGNSDSEDRVGITVKLDGDKIVPSTSDDNASVIIGVISGKPSVVGDAAWNKWRNKHETDDYGRYVWEEYTFTEWTIPATDTEEAVNHCYPTDYIPTDLTVPSDATVISKEEDGTKLMRRKLNSSYNPSTTYIPREQRPEWDAVGMMGKLRIRKGQTVGDRWIKMRDVSSSVEEWLVK